MSLSIVTLRGKFQIEDGMTALRENGTAVEASPARPRRLAVLIPTLGGGGAEAMVATLLAQLDRSKFELTLVLLDGKMHFPVPPDVKTVVLRAPRLKFAVPELVMFLLRDKPDIVMSHMSLANIVALVARGLARERPAVLCVEHNTPTVEYRYGSRTQRLIPMLMRATYRSADAIVSVSRSSARDLEHLLGVPYRPVHVIYNPIVSPALVASAAESVDHPWFSDGRSKVVLSVGRLTRQKNYGLLLEAFSHVLAREERARLVILGEGELRGELEGQAEALEIERFVDLPGFVPNPYPYMRAASVFALSSVYEGLPTVLVEALACGAPVVTTDSPGGAREILGDGRYGTVVPNDDAVALADAILATLAEDRRDAGVERAKDFTVETAIAAYDRLLATL